MITDQSLSWRWSAFSGWSSLWGRNCWQLLWLLDWASDLDFSPQSSQKSICSTPKKVFAAHTKKYLQHIQKSICSTHKKVFAAFTKKYLQHIQRSICSTQKKVFAKLTQKFLQHIQNMFAAITKSICSTHTKILRALAKFWDIAVVNYQNFLSKASTIYLCPLNAKVTYFQVWSLRFGYFRYRGDKL